MKIVTDSASFYSPEEGREQGIVVIPACTIIGEEVYRDYEDIDTEELLRRIEQGDVPTTSQPSIADVEDAFGDGEEEILVLSIGDGLSGTYQIAVGVKNSMDDGERIHVVDTKTLGAAQRYLVRKAVELRAEGFSIERIKKELLSSIETSVSFVIPADFAFLKRSGRLTAIAATIGSVIKIVPVLTQTEDKKQIAPFAIKRSMKKAVEAVINHLQRMGADERYLISVSHAGAKTVAENVMAQIREKISGAVFELYQLSPALVTHGGPGSIVIQAIRR